MHKGRAKRQLSRIYKREKGICSWCKAPVPRDQASRDHVVSLKKGGTNDDSNVVLACKGCNALRNEEARSEPS
ncbi:HNH endonuclease [Streptosporangium sp. NPDC020072]|uniref:HNH endonuclease n=1 Tax=Streptosporangium sp. NPDC020072 TaxID=3154788 RepID=UPI00342F3167